MPTYYVKTIGTIFQDAKAFSRTLLIEADSFRLNKDTRTYEFLTAAKTAKKAQTIVASIPQNEVFAVLEEEAYLADYLYDLDTDEPEIDDVCLDCRAQEIIDTDAFSNAVFEMIDYWHEHADDEEPDFVPGEPQPDPPSGVEPVPVPETPVAVPDPEPFPIEHWIDQKNKHWYGFNDGSGFVHFSDKVGAEYGRESHIKYNRTSDSWSHLNLTGCTKVED
jgi:hypothetical protein